MKDADGSVIDYKLAVTGNLRIVPEGAARDALQEDYAAMIGDGMLLGESFAFGQLMRACSDIQERMIYRQICRKSHLIPENSFQHLSRCIEINRQPGTGSIRDRSGSIAIFHLWMGLRVVSNFASRYVHQTFSCW